MSFGLFHEKVLCDDGPYEGARLGSSSLPPQAASRRCRDGDKRRFDELEWGGMVGVDGHNKLPKRLVETRSS